VRPDCNATRSACVPNGSVTAPIVPLGVCASPTISERMVRIWPLYIYIHTCYSSPRVMGPLVHHPDQPTRQKMSQSTHASQPQACPHGSEATHTFAPPLIELIGSTPRLSRRAPIKPIDPARAPPHVAQPFSIVAQAFCYIVSHFATMNSTILSHILEIFCSVILLE
jgi:hypothetical protein